MTPAQKGEEGVKKCPKFADKECRFWGWGMGPKHPKILGMSDMEAPLKETRIEPIKGFPAG